MPHENAWDGDGKDPWLPQRLAARLDADTHERALRQAIWSALSGWLTTVSRRVMRGGSPDPDEIFAAAPQWVERVEEITGDTIRPIMGEMYGRLLGNDFPFQQRTFVSNYLSEVQNRMVRVPEETFDLVAGQVAQGSSAGESMQDIASRVDQVLSTTDTERWPNRATVTARTETMGALNASRDDSFVAAEEETGDTFQKQWLATIDSRTRDSHMFADGMRVPVGQPFQLDGGSLEFPGDPSGPPEEVIQCRCTTLLVRPGEDVDLSDRQLL